MGMATACYRSITWRTMDKTPMRTGPRNAPLREPFRKWVYYVLLSIRARVVIEHIGCWQAAGVPINDQPCPQSDGHGYCYHILSCTIIYYHILSYTIVYYHILSYTIIYYHMLSFTIIYYHILSYTIYILLYNIYINIIINIYPQIWCFESMFHLCWVNIYIYMQCTYIYNYGVHCISVSLSVYLSLLPIFMNISDLWWVSDTHTYIYIYIYK